MKGSVCGGGYTRNCLYEVFSLFCRHLLNVRTPPSSRLDFLGRCGVSGPAVTRVDG